MPRITTVLCRFVSPWILVAVAACDGTSGTDGAGPAAIRRSGFLPPAACLPEEAVIVVGGSPTQTTVAAESVGTWRAPIALPGSKQAIAYLSPADQLAVFWTDQAFGFDRAHFTRTSKGASFELIEGEAFETSDFTDWRPEETSRILDVHRAFLVDRDQWGSGVAQLDFDTMAWRSFDSTLLDATSVAIDPRDFSFMFAGRGDDGALCEHTRSVDANAWFPLQCRKDIPVAGGGDSPTTGPQAILFPNGDAAIVYLPAGKSSTIAATIVPDGNHDVAWLAPDAITSPAIGISFAAAGTASGDVIVGVVSVLGEVSMLRYSRDRGWSSPVFIDRIPSSAQHLAAATGVCGDDALIAYAAGGRDGELRVARVRGDAVEATTVARIAGDAPQRISIATRQTSPTPAPEP
jgi:hypothetical protein